MKYRAAHTYVLIDCFIEDIFLLKTHVEILKLLPLSSFIIA